MLRLLLPSSVRKRLPKPSPRVMIAFGLASIVTSMGLLLSVVGLVPDGRQDILDGRKTLTESIAISVNIILDREAAEQSAITSVGTLLGAVVERDERLLSAALRDVNGAVTVSAGDHSLWQPLGSGRSSDSSVQVPIQMQVAGENALWQTLELRFTPVVRSGLVATVVDSPITHLLVPLGLGTFAAFYLFLGRVLEQLDPAKAVPSRVRSALDTLAEGLLVLDRDARVMLANEAFSAIIGKPAEKVVGSTACNLPWRRVEQTTGDDGETVAVTVPFADDHTFPWTRTIAENRPQSNVVLKLETASGMRTFIVNCSPVAGPEGEAHGVLASFEDITLLEQKKVELELSMRAAEEASAAKSSFLANMSHEIRTPMNAILGFADVLRRGFVASDAERQRHLNTIHSSGKHLLDLINDILDLSKVEAGRLEVEHTPCSIHRIVGEVVSVLGVKAREKSIGLSHVSESAIPETTLCDPTRLRQIVTNIVGNALKFTETGGVTIATGLDRSGEDAMLTIDVRDTGIGMSPEVCERIFEAFVQADSSTTRKFGGTGLGLAISRKFAEALGGTIYATSEPGAGSTFHISIALPAFDPAAAFITVDEFEAREAAAAGPTQEDGEFRLPGGRVLVVDDGEDNRRLIKLVLGRAGMTVLEAGNGLEALERIADQTEPVDLVFMDMQMPVLDGYTASRRLREQGFEAPIVALTGNAMKGDEEKCREAGCSHFLPKPVDLDDLMQTTIDAIKAIPTDRVAAVNETAVAADARVEPSAVEPMAQTDEAIRLDDASVEKASVDDSSAAAGLPPISDDLAALLSTITDEFGEEESTAPAGPVASAEVLTAFDDATDVIESTLPADDPEFAVIIAGFADRLNERLVEMQEARAAADWNAIAEFGHWLKGAGGTLGFAVFTEPAARLEERAHFGDAASVDHAFETISSLARRIRVNQLA